MLITFAEHINVFTKCEEALFCPIQKRSREGVINLIFKLCLGQVNNEITKEFAWISRSSRAIPTGIKRAMAIRDGACGFRGCNCHTHLYAHPIQHWANGGETSLDNLISVCKFHHTLLHEGQYSVERLRDGTLQFKRPDGSANVQPVSINAKQIPATSNQPWSWCSDTMDYRTALYNIAHHNRTAAAQ